MILASPAIQEVREVAPPGGFRRLIKEDRSYEMAHLGPHPGECTPGWVVHHNVTAHPTADRTLQQFREALPGDHGHQCVIHDRDRIYSHDLDQGVESMGVRVVSTPVRTPKASGY
jgi:hypothetical protein